MKQLTFNYNLEDFVTNVKLISMYRASTMQNNGGETMVQNAMAGEEDDSYVRRYLKMGATEVADLLSGYSKSTDGLMVPFEYDADFDESESQIVFRIEVPDTYVIGNINQVDESIKDMIENFILFRTNKQKALEWQSYFDDYERAKSKILSCINRRSEPIVRTLNLF